jgi:hypothetical protein
VTQHVLGFESKSTANPMPKPSHAHAMISKVHHSTDAMPPHRDPDEEDLRRKGPVGRSFPLEDPLAEFLDPSSSKDSIRPRGLSAYMAGRGVSRGERWEIRERR